MDEYHRRRMPYSRLDNDGTESSSHEEEDSEIRVVDVQDKMKSDGPASDFSSLT